MAARHVDVTHVGSLPRGDELTPLLLAKDHGKPYDAAEFERVVQAAIDDAVKRIRAAGRAPGVLSTPATVQRYLDRPA